MSFKPPINRHVATSYQLQPDGLKASEKALCYGACDLLLIGCKNLPRKKVNRFIGSVF